MGAFRITLARKIGLLLLLPLITSITAVGFFASYLRTTRNDAHFVNVAGRQRMLSAELRAWVDMVAIGQEDDRQGLRLRTAEFDESLTALRQGGLIQNSILEPAPAEIRPSLDGVADIWRELKPDLDFIAATPRTSPLFRKTHEGLESRIDDLKDRSTRVVTAVEARWERLRQRMFYVLDGIAGFMGLLFIAGLALSRRYITRPILRLDEAARRISDGDFSLKLDPAGQDELSTLAKTFNAMASRVGQLLDALNLRRKHAETIIASMPAGLLVLRGDLTVLRTNWAFREMFGLDESAAAGRPLEDVLPAVGLREATLEVLATRRTKHSLRFEMAGRDGVRRPLRMTIAGTRLAEEEEEEEEEEELLLVIEDLTEQERSAAEHERAEAAIQESERRFRQMAENIEEVFWMTDPKKNEMLYVSPAYEKIWGRTCESLFAEPQNWLDAIHPEDRDRVLQAALMKQARGDYAEEYRIVRPDKSVRWIRDRAFPVKVYVFSDFGNFSSLN